MSTLICLGGGIEGLPILERARALGHDLVVVDGNANAPGFVGKTHDVVAASCYDAAEVLGAYELDPSNSEYCGPFDGVICCAIDAPHVAAAVAQAFGLPGLTPAQAHLSVDKLAQKVALKAAGLPVPDFWPNGHDMPVGLGGFVIKPQDGRGARGVYLARKFAPVMRAWVEDAQAQSRTGQYITEQYLDGPQLSTESIVQDGRVLFTAIGLRNYDRLAEFAPHIIEDGYDMPWGDSYLRVKVDALLTQACATLGWDTLTVKGDWIIHDGKLVILELAARLSGGFFGTHGIPLAYGVDFVGEAISLALGEHRPVQRRVMQGILDRFVSQRYVFPAPGDIGRRVVSVGYIADHNKADFWTWAIHPGDVIAPVVSHGQRWGQATCTGATPEQARERAERAVAAMKAAVVLE